MPSPPKMTAPAFGAWMEQLRGERSPESVAVQVRQVLKGQDVAVNRSQIEKIEKGRPPSWAMLGALSKVYKIELSEMAARLIGSVRFADGSDLPRHGGDQTSGSLQGDPADASPPVVERDRVSYLEQQIAHYEHLLAAAQDVATSLIHILAGRGETPSPREGTTVRGRRDRGGP